MDKKCLGCGADFDGVEQQLYCSTRCRQRCKRSRKTGIAWVPPRCKACGGTLPESEGKGRRRHYCSDACRKELARIKSANSRVLRLPERMVCQCCGVEFATAGKRGDLKYCSKKCYSQIRNKGGECRHCGKPSRGLFCSDACEEMRKAVATANKMYRAMRYRTSDTHRRNKTYWDKEVRFTQDEFIEWAKPELVKFYASEPDGIASVDRIDPDGHYELGNIRILSWRLNALRSRFHLKSFGVSVDQSRETNLLNIARSVEVMADEVGITKEQVIAYLQHEQERPQAQG